MLCLRVFRCDCTVRGFGDGRANELRIDLTMSSKGPACALVPARLKPKKQTINRRSEHFIKLTDTAASLKECQSKLGAKSRRHLGGKRIKLRKKSSTYRWPPAENNVFLCPRMNTATMCAGKFLRFHGRILPELFFYCPSGVDEFRG